MFNVRTMAGLYREATGSRRFAALLVGTFACAGLVLMAIGLFGVLSYVVTQQTREIGLRLALGSEPRGCPEASAARRCFVDGVGRRHRSRGLRRSRTRRVRIPVWGAAYGSCHTRDGGVGANRRHRCSCLRPGSTCLLCRSAGGAPGRVVASRSD